MARTEFHEDAHPEATEITGDRDYGPWGQCVVDPASTTGERCTAPAKGPHGKCHSHGGSTPTKDENPDVGAPEGNSRAVSHGAYAEHNKFYQEVLDDGLRGVADDIFAGYVEDYRERHGDPPMGHEAELFRIAVSHVKDVNLENWAEERPDELDSGNALVDREVHYSDEGDQYYRYKESVVQKAQKRLSTDRRQWLKDFGLLSESPDAKAAEALGGLKEAWKERAGSE